MGLFSRIERAAEKSIEGTADRFSNAPVSPSAIAKRLEKRMHSERMVGSGVQYAPTLYTVLVNPQDDRAMMGYYPTLSGELETMLVARANESGLVLDGQPLVRFIADSTLRSGKFEVIAESVAAPIVEQLRDDELQRYGISRGRYEAELQQKRAREQAAQQEARREELRARSERRAQQAQRQNRRDRMNALDQEAAGANGEANYRNPYAPYDEGSAAQNGGLDGEQDMEAYYGSEPGPDGKRRLPYVPEEEIDRSIDYGEYTFNSLDFSDLESERAESERSEYTPAAAPQTPAPAQAAPAPSPYAPYAESEAYAPSAPQQSYAPVVPSPSTAAPSPSASATPAPSPSASYVPAATPSPSYTPAQRAPAPAAAPQVAFTPASRIAPVAHALPARAVPGVLDREQPDGKPTTIMDTAPSEPATLPYSDLERPAPRYRVRNLQNGRSYTLTGTRVYIGRESICNIAIEDLNASRRHAELRRSANGVWTISDLNSTNGTFVNGSLVTSATLADGDRITVGTTDLIFVVC